MTTKYVKMSLFTAGWTGGAGATEASSKREGEEVVDGAQVVDRPFHARPDRQPTSACRRLDSAARTYRLHAGQVGSPGQQVDPGRVTAGWGPARGFILAGGRELGVRLGILVYSQLVGNINFILPLNNARNATHELAATSDYRLVTSDIPH